MNELSTNWTVKVGLPYADWDFPIETFDLAAIKDGDPHYHHVPPSMARCIVRTDTNEVLGVHGSKYKAITHNDVVNSIFDAVGKSGISNDYESKVELFDNGAKMRGTITFNDLVIEPKVDDYIKFQVKFYNSYDGSWAFQQQAMGLRLWCLNGCTHADTVANTWAKHTTNVNVEGSANKIRAGLESFFNTKNQYKAWMDTHVNDDDALHFFKYSLCRIKNNTGTLKWNERQLDNLMGLWFKERDQLGSNKWALYNACTYWATHTDNNKSPANTARIRENAIAKVFKKSNWHIV